jgi:cytochrome c oxidase cbb3-type subunit 3
MTEQQRYDDRGEWFREWDPWNSTINVPPNWYWLGMALSALWVVIYLLIYPSIPLVNGHWQGLGVPGGCQPWTAICEMQQGESVVNEVRGRYLDKIQKASVEEVLADSGLSEFVQSAGKVRFDDHCAACHGTHGIGTAGFADIAPVLNDEVWLHGGQMKAIKQSIENPKFHPAGLIQRNDELHTKILAVYVYKLGGGVRTPQH